MDLVPLRRPGDYDPAEDLPRRGGGPDLISAAEEARRRPGEWAFAGFCKAHEPWALTAWRRDVRQGRKASLGGKPGDWDAYHFHGVMVDGEFIPEDPDEPVTGGEPSAAKFVAYVGEVTR